MSSPRLFASSHGSTVDVAGRVGKVKTSNSVVDLYEAFATPYIQVTVITAIDRRLRELLNTTNRPHPSENAFVKCGKRACRHVHRENDRTGRDAKLRSLCPKCGVEPSYWFATPLDVLAATARGDDALNSIRGS